MKNTLKDWPDIRDGTRGLRSIDVLIYIKKIDQHFIGWFDFSEMKWKTDSGEILYKGFRWRKLDLKTDKY